MLRYTARLIRPWPLRPEVSSSGADVGSAKGCKAVRDVVPYQLLPPTRDQLQAKPLNTHLQMETAVKAQVCAGPMLRMITVILEYVCNDGKTSRNEQRPQGATVEWGKWEV